MTTSEELRNLSQQATPGPLTVYRYTNGARLSKGHDLIADVYDIPNREFYAALSPDVVLRLLDVVDAAEKWRGAYERRQAWLAGNGEEPAQAGLVAAQADLALAVDAFRGERHEP